jgi:hypothetical protein
MANLDIPDRVLDLNLTEFLTVSLEEINNGYLTPQCEHAQCACEGCVMWTGYAWLYNDWKHIPIQDYFKKLIMNQRPFNQDSIIMPEIAVVKVEGFKFNDDEKGDYIDYNTKRVRNEYDESVDKDMEDIQRLELTTDGHLRIKDITRLKTIFKGMGHELYTGRNTEIKAARVRWCELFIRLYL